MNTDVGTLGEAARRLLEGQKGEWETLRGGYESLAGVRTKEIAFEGFGFRVQFNPRRIVSSGAKVDAKSIAERKCFLCGVNRPPEQRGVEVGEYVVLVNPFPIMPEHFTVPHVSHVPQRLGAAEFGAMLEVARGMSGRYTVFYNGPRCGASAPDHLHFQAGTAGFMPVEGEYEKVVAKYGEVISERGGVRVCAVGEGYLRSFVGMESMESADKAALEGAFARFVAACAGVVPGEEEPMMNVLASYARGGWRVIVFPRAKHRPSMFFEEGEGKMVLSPASVDFGGVCITPVERDFERVNEGILRKMFAECSLVGEGFRELVGRLKSGLA